MTTPAVSIILPTYNRAAFLPQAFESIRSQTFSDWELIVVDDGSTDDTRSRVADLARGWARPVRYHRRDNGGAYAARNTGLDLAVGRYVAFFDSDDVWLPHHLDGGARALDANPDVEWVFSDSRTVDFLTGRTIRPSSFHRPDGPLEFLRLRADRQGPLRILRDDRAVELAIRIGFGAGLQCAVIRRTVFDRYRFEASQRNEAEDQLLIIESLAAGRTFAYLDDVTVVYHTHGENSSAAGTGTVEKRLRVFRELAAGFERLRDRVRLTPAQARALDRRLAGEYVWNLGYVLLREPGRTDEALALLRRGMRLDPLNPAYWKVYAAARLRARTSRLPAPTA